MEQAFSFQKFPCIETKRLKLRKTEKRDLQDIYELYANEEVVKHTPMDAFITREDAWQEVIWHWEIYTQQIGLRWLIEDKESGKVIGSCGYLNYLKEHSRIEIGYDLAPSFWGRGIMSEAAEAVLDFGFNGLNVNRIVAKVEPRNKASIRLLSRLGFMEESRLRENVFEKETFSDLYLYSLLRSDYMDRYPD